jgi:hypothetical protein
VPYHQLVFIWIRDPALFAEYLHDLPPIVARYGGAADLSLHPTAIQADPSLPLPDVVNLVHYDSREAYHRFNADPDFRRIEPARADSVDLMTFEGHLRVADPTPADAQQRVFHVELATYRDGNPEAYRAYERRAEGRRRAHGYHVEYILEAETAPAQLPHPDVVTIASFPGPVAADPDARDIEEQLYLTATEHAIRLTGLR